jgi:hypothetical protein
MAMSQVHCRALTSRITRVPKPALSEGRRTRSPRARVGASGRAAVVVAFLCLGVFGATAASASAESATYSTYSAEQSVPVPPASNFQGNGGGDGWAVALSEKNVYNVFHHQTYIGVACHEQSNAQSCSGWPKTITETGTNASFSSSGHPGLYLDHTTGKLFVYATRDDSTAGVVCIDTEEATNPDPFCGFTALTNPGEAESSGYSDVSPPMLVGNHWYAFNAYNGKGQSGAENAVLCFDVSTDTACSGQPYDVALGSGTLTGSLPGPPTSAIGNKLMIPVDIEGDSRLACFDDSTQSTCAGAWPATIASPGSYESGGPFPLLDTTGKITGVCLPTGADPCFNLDGSSAATPANLPTVVTDSSIWNGPAFVLGPRVYIPNGNTDEVQCFDYSKGEGCEHFPKVLPGIVLLYTVNPDPQRPTCIWVNSDADDGTAPIQIESFDAYTGEACGGGTVRVLASQFVAPAPQCMPANYVSLQVLQPPRSNYSTGTVAFANGDGELIPGLPEIALDETGSASLNGLDLNTTTGLPQFLFTLQNPIGPVGAVKVRLTWEGNYDESCIGQGQTVVRPPTPAPAPTTTTTTTATPTAGVLPFQAASPKACTSKRQFTIHIQNVKQLGLVSAVVEVDGKNAKTLRGKGLSTAINLVGLPQGTFTVEIVGHRRDGRTVKGERVYHTCVPKLPGHAYLPL